MLRHLLDASRKAWPYGSWRARAAPPAIDPMFIIELPDFEPTRPSVYLADEADEPGPGVGPRAGGPEAANGVAPA